MKTKEIRLTLRKHSILNDGEVKKSLIDYMKRELALELKNYLDIVVNEEVVENTYKVYEVSVDFLYVDIPKNEEELLSIIRSLIAKYSKSGS